jgi:hypothetical protein
MPAPGKALIFDDAELLALSNLSETDILAAQQWAQNYGDAEMLAILFALDWARRKEDHGDYLNKLIASLAFLYFWDQTQGLYRNEYGRIVPFASIREALDKTLDYASAPGRGVVSLAEQLQTKRISVKDWQVSMMGEIRNTHINSAVAASGGYQFMSPADWDRVGLEIHKHYEYLNRFAIQIERNEVLLDGRFVTRSKMYVQAGRQTHEYFVDADQAARGYVQVRNMLQDTVRACNTCGGRIGCIQITELGWMRYDDPQWVVPGARCCLGKCRCKVLRRNPDTGDERF